MLRMLIFTTIMLEIVTMAYMLKDSGLMELIK